MGSSRPIYYEIIEGATGVAGTAGAIGAIGIQGATGVGGGGSSLNKYTGKITSITPSYTVDNTSFCIPYQLQDGSWMLKFWANVSSNGSRSSVTLQVSDATMLPALFACTGNDQNYPIICYAVGGIGGIVTIESYDPFTDVDGNPIAISNLMVYGDIPLTAKPSWAI